jgi:hypothetical protein
VRVSINAIARERGKLPPITRADARIWAGEPRAEVRSGKTLKKAEPTADTRLTLRAVSDC